MEEEEEASVGRCSERAGLVTVVSKNGMAEMWTTELRRMQAITYQNEIDDKNSITATENTGTEKIEYLTFKVHVPSVIVKFGGQSDFATTRFLGIEIEQNIFSQTIDRLDTKLVEDPDESTIVSDSSQMLLK